VGFFWGGGGGGGGCVRGVRGVRCRGDGCWLSRKGGCYWVGGNYAYYPNTAIAKILIPSSPPFSFLSFPVHSLRKSDFSTIFKKTPTAHG